MSTPDPIDSTTPATRNRKWRFWLFAIVIIIAICLISYYSLHARNNHHNDREQAIAVVAAIAQSKDVPVYLTALGSVTPDYNVIVKTQINGQLLHVFFQEGQTVKTGDLLAEIDPRPYQAQLTEYEGQFARDSALLTNAQLDLKRYTKLWKQNSVAKQTLDTQASLVKQDEGTVKLDQGLIDSTKVNLTYCEITSPINGRTGLLQVDPGNFVQTTDTNGIVIINTLNPITVIFSLPEDNVPEVMQQINTGKTLTVEAYNRSQKQLLATGVLLTVDNQIDPTTGTVKLKAEFENKDNQLFPNQFVNIELLVNTLHNATVVPTAAIQHGTQGNFVYLLLKNQTVRAQTISTGVTYDDHTVITQGILPGQSVIVEGADKLTDNTLVKVSMQ